MGSIIRHWQGRRKAIEMFRFELLLMAIKIYRIVGGVSFGKDRDFFRYFDKFQSIFSDASCTATSISRQHLLAAWLLHALCICCILMGVQTNAHTCTTHSREWKSLILCFPFFCFCAPSYLRFLHDFNLLVCACLPVCASLPGCVCVCLSACVCACVKNP